MVKGRNREVSQKIIAIIWTGGDGGFGQDHGGRSGKKWQILVVFFFIFFKFYCSGFCHTLK